MTALTVYTIADLCPAIFRDGSRRWTGYEYQLLESFAHAHGMCPDVRVVPFDRIWLRPRVDGSEVAAAGISILPGRTSQGVRFSRPTFQLHQSLLVRADDAARLSDVRALAGRMVGVLTGTTGEDSLRRRAPASTVFVPYAAEVPMLDALRGGLIDAIARGTLGNAHQARPGTGLAVTAVQPGSEWTGFAVPAANEWLGLRLDAHLEQLRATGTLRQLHQRWFPQLPVPAQLCPAE